MVQTLVLGQGTGEGRRRFCCRRARVGVWRGAARLGAIQARVPGRRRDAGSDGIGVFMSLGVQADVRGLSLKWALPFQSRPHLGGLDLHPGPGGGCSITGHVEKKIKREKNPTPWENGELLLNAIVVVLAP